MNTEQPDRRYWYRLTYTEESQLFPNFGHSKFNLPLMVYRDYSEESDDHVRGLSDPQATKIEKRILDPKGGEDTPWEELPIT